MEDEIQSLRQRLFDLSCQLPKTTNDRIAELAKSLRTDRRLFLEDVLWRAAGNSLPEPADIARETSKAYRRLLDVLEPHFNTKAKVSAFNKKFVAPIVDHEEKKLPETWRNIFVSRLSDETQEKIVRLHRYYGLSLDLTPPELATIPYLREPAFRKHEQSVLLPLLDRIEKEAIDKELSDAGVVFDGSAEATEREKAVWKRAKAKAFTLCREYMLSHPRTKTPPMPEIRKAVREFYPGVTKREETKKARTLRTTIGRIKTLRTKARRIPLYSGEK